MQNVDQNSLMPGIQSARSQKLAICLNDCQIVIEVVSHAAGQHAKSLEALILGGFLINTALLADVEHCQNIACLILTQLELFAPCAEIASVFLQQVSPAPFKAGRTGLNQLPQ